jgi:hypothetical protein
MARLRAGRPLALEYSPFSCPSLDKGRPSQIWWPPFAARSSNTRAYCVEASHTAGRRIGLLGRVLRGCAYRRRLPGGLYPPLPNPDARVLMPMLTFPP